MEFEKIILILFVLLISCDQAPKHDKRIDDYVAFLDNNHTLAIDYVLSLFEEHDIVILCERDHRENTQYEFLTDLISDPRFIKNVGDVFTEVGMTNLNPELNNFIHSENLSQEIIDKKLIEFQRNASYYPLWNKFNFYYLNQQLYNINQTLLSEDKINIHPTNNPLKLDSLDYTYYKSVWNSIIQDRDSLMAQNIIDEFEKIKKSNSKRKKALVIMNYRHAFNTNFNMPNGNAVKNVGGFLFTKYPGEIANVLLNQFEFTDAESEEDITYESTQNGKWDASFEIRQIENCGFNFQDSPFGEDSFDLWPFHEHDYKYEDIFTGFIYFMKPKDFKLVTGVNGLIDSSFIETYKKRVLLWKKITDNRIDYPLENTIIFNEYGIKKETKIEKLDTITTQINKWILN